MGVVKTQLGFDELRPRIESKIDGVLKNDYQVRAILSDKFGYDYDDYEAMVESGQDPKQFARQLLMEDIQDRMQPKYSADQQTVNAANQQAAINQANKEQEQVKTSVVDQRAAADAENINARLNEITEISLDNIGQFKGLGKINDVAQAEDGSYGIKIGKEWIELSSDPAVAKQQIAQYAGVKARHTNSPAKRSPLKRFTDWMGMTK